MRLTRYTDYAIRALMHLATHDAPSSIPVISKAYSISSNHLMKIVFDLGRAGYVTTQRGRGGGIKLARRPEEINLGELIRHTEEDFKLVDCGSCLIAPACTLPRVLNEATAAFLAVLDKYALSDLLSKKSDLRRLFDLPIRDSEPLFVANETVAAPLVGVRAATPKVSTRRVRRGLSV